MVSILCVVSSCVAMIRCRRLIPLILCLLIFLCNCFQISATVHRDLTTTGLVEIIKLVAFDGPSDNFFGYSVSMYGSVVAVGSINDKYSLGKY